MTENTPQYAQDEAYFGDDAATFGDRVAAARESVGLTSLALANRLGVKEATVAKWENDRLEPRANKLQMLAGLLNVSMVWLLTGEGEGVQAASDGRQMGEDVRDIVLELRTIREENARLGARMARLEKTLRAQLNGV